MVGGWRNLRGMKEEWKENEERENECVNFGASLLIFNSSSCFLFSWHHRLPSSTYCTRSPLFLCSFLFSFFLYLLACSRSCHVSTSSTQLICLKTPQKTIAVRPFTPHVLSTSWTFFLSLVVKPKFPKQCSSFLRHLAWSKIEEEMKHLNKLQYMLTHQFDISLSLFFLFKFINFSSYPTKLKRYYFQDQAHLILYQWLPKYNQNICQI